MANASFYISDSLENCTFEDLEAAAAVLAAAFESYPQMNYVFRDEPSGAARRQLLECAMLPIARLACEYGRLIRLFDAASGRLEGVLVLLRQAKYALTPWDFLRLGFWKLPLELGPRAAFRFCQSELAIAAQHEKLAGGGDPYLLYVVAVDPAAQGGGRGRALIERALQVVDGAAAECLLDTAQPALVRFYRQFGFVPVLTAQQDGFTETYMRRPAASVGLNAPASVTCQAAGGPPSLAAPAAAVAEPVLEGKMGIPRVDSWTRLLQAVDAVQFAVTS